MYIQIRELIIRATVLEGSEKPQDGAVDEKEKQEIILQCVEQVSKMLKRQGNR